MAPKSVALYNTTAHFSANLSASIIHSAIGADNNDVVYKLS